MEVGPEENIDCKDEKKNGKKKRKRMKQLCTSIRDQMEFYFGDANLSKDRFIKKEIDKSPDGWLPVEIFTKFNKIKKLTSEESVIAKALSTSSLIELSQDGKCVRRKVPFAEPQDTDDRTIYVEHLPKEADHEWVKGVFCPYGKVLYVSLPRFRSSGDFKGFAFVEFETVQAAKRAREEMDNPPASAADRAGLFPVRGCKDVIRLRHQVEYYQGTQKRQKRKRTLSDPSSSDSVASKEQTATKRARTVSEGDRAECALGRRSATEIAERASSPPKVAEQVEEDDAGAVDSLEGNSEGESGRTKNAKEKERVEKERGKRKRRLSGERGQSSQENSVNENGKKKKVGEGNEEGEKVEKKKKNRSKKNSNRKEKKENPVPELRVLSKAEWLELRSEYIAIQKSNMKKLKQSLQEYKKTERKESEEPPQENRSDADDRMEADDRKEADDRMENGGKKSKGRRMEFTPNVIVRVECHVPMKRVELKEKVKKFGDVAYIDVQNGAMAGHVRCCDATTALRLADAHVANHNFSLVTGEEEARYWEKLTSDQEKKLTTKAKRKKRGKDKLEEKAEETKREVMERKHVSPSADKKHVSLSAEKKHVIFDD